MSQVEMLKEDGEQYDTKFAKNNSILILYVSIYRRFNFVVDKHDKKLPIKFKNNNFLTPQYYGILLFSKKIQLMWYKMLIKTMKRNKYVSSEM